MTCEHIRLSRLLYQADFLVEENETHRRENVFQSAGHLLSPSPHLSAAALRSPRPER